MSAPTIKTWEQGEKITIEDLNQNFQALQQMFGALDGTDLLYPFVMTGDLDMDGNRVLRARETFSIINVGEIGLDHAAFQDAISQLSGGGVAFIPKNTTILLDQPVRVNSLSDRLFIVGCGYTSKIRMANDSNSSGIVFDGASKFKVCNLFIDGNKNNNFSGSGIVVRDGEDFEISNCWIGDTSSTGFSNHCIDIDGCSDFRIKRNWMRYPDESGVVVRNSTDFSITQVAMRNLGKSGVVMEDCFGGLVEGCRVETAQLEGIVVASSDATKISNNNIRNHAQDTTVADIGGIEVYGRNASTLSDGVVVIGNSVLLGGVTGIGIMVGSYVNGSVIANYVRKNTRPLVYAAESKTSHVQFRDNACMDADHHGSISMLAAAQVTHLDIGVTGLPINAIHATWNESTNFTSFSGAVLGAKYAGQTISFYNASALPTAKKIWFSVEV